MELKPKVRHIEAVILAKAQEKPVEKPDLRAEVLPARVNYQVERSYVPRVVAKQEVKLEETGVKEIAREPPRRSKKESKESISSYDSCISTEVCDVVDSSPLRSRSTSSTSYESAPPPVPEASPPMLSESESDRGKGQRSSSTTSESSSISASTGTHQTTDSSETFIRPRVMNFSISTYKSRAEETSYDKRITKSDSFSSRQSSGDGPKIGYVPRREASTAYRDRPEPLSFVDEILGVKERPTEPTRTPTKPSLATGSTVMSRILHLREKSRSQQHIPTFYEKSFDKSYTSSTSGKPAIPPNKPSLQGRDGQPVMRMNSMSDRLAYADHSRPRRIQVSAALIDGQIGRQIDR